MGKKKTSKKKVAPPVTPPHTPAAAAATPCRIRMYRQGFGDCFLLTFPDGAKKKHVMIDCGVVTKAADRKLKIKAVLEDIIKVTGGSVDLLIATHEHFDHVSAFTEWKEYFTGPTAKLSFKAIWMAWTEKPGDPLANQIGEKEERVGMALNAAAERLNGLPGITGARIDRMQGFGAFSKSTDEAMDLIRKLGEDIGGPKYLEPGQVEKDFGIPGVRAYVLGPPRDDKLLKITNPRSGEAYADFAAAAFIESVLGMAVANDAGEWVGKSAFPLDPGLRCPIDVKITPPEEDQRSGLAAIREAYTNLEDDWRRIDNDWLGYAETLALQMNSYTNNTSAVVAFELIDSGRVLLFAADAQVGNWMSWWGFKADQRADGVAAPSGKPLSFQLALGEKSALDIDHDQIVTMEDLFRNIVLYKVGHHASHNGTLGIYGLNRLKHANLVAMMTTNKEDAIKSGWDDIPDSALLPELLTATRGRVFASDDQYGVSAALQPPQGAYPQDAAAWAAFKKATTVGPVDPTIGGPLYFDYEL